MRLTCSSVSARFSCTKRKHNISGNQRKPIFLDEIRTAFFYINQPYQFPSSVIFVNFLMQGSGIRAANQAPLNFPIFQFFLSSDIQGIDKVSLHLLRFADSVLRILLFYGCCIKMIISEDKILLKRGLCLFLCLFFVCSFFLSVSKESAKKNFNWEANNSLLLIVSANQTPFSKLFFVQSTRLCHWKNFKEDVRFIKTKSHLHTLHFTTNRTLQDIFYQHGTGQPPIFWIFLFCQLEVL